MANSADKTVGGIKGFFLRVGKSFQSGAVLARDVGWWLAQNGGRWGLFLASTSMVVLMPLIFEINREVSVRYNCRNEQCVENIVGLSHAFPLSCKCNRGSKALFIAAEFADYQISWSFWNKNFLRHIFASSQVICMDANYYWRFNHGDFTFIWTIVFTSPCSLRQQKDYAMQRLRNPSLAAVYRYGLGFSIPSLAIVHCSTSKYARRRKGKSMR